MVGPGFTLPANIGDLDPPGMTELDLSRSQLSGTQLRYQQSIYWFVDLQSFQPLHASFHACVLASGAIPASLGQLTNLTRVLLGDNQLSGEMAAVADRICSLPLPSMLAVAIALSLFFPRKLSRV